MRDFINIEMRLLDLVDRENRSGRIVKAVFEMHVPDAEFLRGLIGKRFGTALTQIGDDEKPVVTKLTKRYTQLGNIHRNDPPYQQVLREYFENKEGYEWIENHNRLDPAERRKVTAAIQHQFCGVQSLKDIQPNTQAALRFDLLESLYEADKAGLPPPEMDPDPFKIIAHVDK